MEILNLWKQKDSYNTIKDLEVEFTLEQTESDNYTPSGISLMKIEHFIEILTYYLVKEAYIFLWALLNIYQPSNCIYILMTVQTKNVQSLK